jgi:hypothetical protein
MNEETIEKLKVLAERNSWEEDLTMNPNFEVGESLLAQEILFNLGFN